MSDKVFAFVLGFGLSSFISFFIIYNKHYDVYDLRQQLIKENQGNYILNDKTGDVEFKLKKSWESLNKNHSYMTDDGIWEHVKNNSKFGNHCRASLVFYTELLEDKIKRQEELDKLNQKK